MGKGWVGVGAVLHGLLLSEFPLLGSYILYQKVVCRGYAQIRRVVARLETCSTTTKRKSPLGAFSSPDSMAVLIL